jgi:prolyl-tRNA synthetase
LKDHTKEASTLEDLSRLIEEGNMVWAPWDGTAESANAIKDKTKATIRLLPEEEKSVKGKDLVSGKAATTMALFAKSY